MSGGRQQSQVTLDKLRRDILNGTLRPGAEITEMSIADRYKTGRASARTALQRLAETGLVRSVPRRGYIIPPVTIRDVREIFEIRLALEPLAARLAAGRVDGPLLRKHEEAALRGFEENGPFDDTALANNTFIHGHIARATGNARLVRQLELLHGEMERLILIGFTGGSNVPQMLHEHMPIIDALEAGRAELAYDLMYEHIDTSQRNVMDALVGRDTVLDQPIHAVAQ